MSRPIWITVGLFVVLVHAVAYFGNGLLSSPLQLGYEPNVTADALPLARWDAGWYRSIAADGYFWDKTTGVGNVAFFPLYPILVRAIAVSGLSFFWAATLLSHACFVVSVVLLQRFHELGRGTGQDHSQLFALLAFPWAFFLLAPYSEALFLALALGAFVAAHRGRWGLVALLGFSAGLTRLFGLALVPPLLLLALRAESWSSVSCKAPRVLRAIAACAPVMGFASFVSWLALQFRDPLVFLHAQQRGWGRVPGWGGLQASIEAVADNIHNRGWLHLGPAVDLLVFLMLIAAVVYALRSRSLASASYVGSGVALIAASGSLLSAGRYALVLFPVFGVLAVLARRPIVWLAYLALSSALQVYLVVRFVNELWVA